MSKRLEPFLPNATRVSTEDVMRAMQTPIALVGNGPIAGGLGKKIDSFATIIRCNNFRLSGYEDQTGMQTTHWCIHGLIDRMLGRSRWKRFWTRVFEPTRVYGILPNPHVGDEVIAFCPRAFDWMAINNMRKKLGIDPPCLHDASLLIPISAQVPHPTIGFTAAALLLQFHERISLFGFSGLKSGHYWNPKERHERSHLTGATREYELLSSCDRIELNR